MDSMRTSYTIKNSIISFISNIASFIFLFITRTIFIKYLGIEYSGLNGLFADVFTLLNLFELGIGNAIVFNMYKNIKNNNIKNIKALVNYYKKTYYFIALFILLFGLLFIPFLKYIVKGAPSDINIIIVYFLFLLSTITSYIMAYKRIILFSYQKNYLINIIHILVYVVLLNIVQIIIIIYTKNYYLFLVAKILFIIIENLIISNKTNKLFSNIVINNKEKINNKMKKDILKRSKSLFIHKASSVVTHGTDNIIISSFLGISTLGLYMNYYYIMHTIQSLFTSVIDASRASVGNLLVDNNYDKNYTIFKRILFLNTWISIFTSICFLCLIEPFIKIWLGSSYLFNYYVLIVLVINYFQSMMRVTFNIFKDSAGIWVEDRVVPIIQMLINLVFSIFLVKMVGLSGVFIGTIFSSFVLWFYSYPKCVYKKLFNKNYKHYYFGMIKIVVLMIFVAILTYYPISLISFNNIIFELIIKIVICFLMSNGLLFVINIKNDNLKYYIQLILKRTYN